MADNRPYSREIAALIESTRETTRRSQQVLSDNPKPDTFAGRKTQEPFPKEDDKIIKRWVGSRELQPPTE